MPSFTETWDLDGTSGSFAGYGLALSWQALAPEAPPDLDAFMVALLQVVERLLVVRHTATVWEDYAVLRACVAEALIGLRALAEEDAPADACTSPGGA